MVTQQIYIQDWNSVEWNKVSAKVFRIQNRIFLAKRVHNATRLHWLQKTLARSVAARLLAVRQVTTLNKGKRTSGFDRRVADTPQEKLRLVKNLRLDGKASPIRRVWIPKPGKKEMRPLGIPVMEDRAKQALAKLVLEPEWEAVFEPNSYGFRPGRSCADAVEAIFLNLRVGKPKYVFDADIAKCFDRIDHDSLIRKLETYTEMEEQVRAWLKSGIVEGFAKGRLKAKEAVPTTAGTPQGGIVSPLLANIALHGLENHLREIVGRRPGPSGRANRGYNAKSKALGFVRYADDFVLFHDDLFILQLCIDETRKWLAGIGLAISEEKSSIRDAREGFNFLGFQFIMLKRKSTDTYKIKIRPSTPSIYKLRDKVKTIISRNKASSSYDLICKLRPVIIGWANYFRVSECSRDFHKIQHMIFLKLRAWVFRRSVRVGRKATRLKYFPPRKEYYFNGKLRRGDWVLVGRKKVENGEVKTNFLPYLDWVSSKKHVKVKGDVSPYDPNALIYWTERMQKYSSLPSGVSYLIKRQRGKCPLCGEKFTVFDAKDWEVDHIVPKTRGGADGYDNLQLVHKSCHIKKTRAERSKRK